MTKRTTGVWEVTSPQRIDPMSFDGDDDPEQACSNLTNIILDATTTTSFIYISL